MAEGNMHDINIGAGDPHPTGGEIVPKSKSLQFGQYSIHLSRKVRVVVSLVGLGALCVPASYFLSEFNQIRVRRWRQRRLWKL